VARNTLKKYLTAFAAGGLTFEQINVLSVNSGDGNPSYRL
jgi:hypothetical protein